MGSYKTPVRSRKTCEPPSRFSITSKPRLWGVKLARLGAKAQRFFRPCGARLKRMFWGIGVIEGRPCTPNLHRSRFEQLEPMKLHQSSPCTRGARRTFRCCAACWSLTSLGSRAAREAWALKALRKNEQHPKSLRGIGPDPEQGPPAP